MAAAQYGAVDTDQIPQVEGQQSLEPLWAEHVDARVQLDLARPIDQVEERGLARTPPRCDTAGDTVGILGLLTGPEMPIGVQNRGDGLGVCKRVGKRLGVGIAQALGLGPPLGDQLGQAVASRLLGRGALGSAHSGETT